jgi:hypothetical protein
LVDKLTTVNAAMGWMRRSPRRGVQLTSRAIATVAEGRVRLQSRQLRSLTPFFPDVVDALGTWFRDVVLDGELVVCRDGRLDFTALQRRLVNPRAAAEAPASFRVRRARGGRDRPACLPV